MRRIAIDIHERDDWPRFLWDREGPANQLAAVRHRQGRLIGRMEGLGFRLREEAVRSTLTQDVLKSSEIEGAILDIDQVRSRCESCQARSARRRSTTKLPPTDFALGCESLGLNRDVVSAVFRRSDLGVVPLISSNRRNGTPPMRLPRVQFKVRFLMAAVVFVAVPLGVWISYSRLKPLAAVYRVTASRHAALEVRYVRDMKDQAECFAFWSGLARERTANAASPPEAEPFGPFNAVESWSELADQASDQASYHARLQRESASKADRHAVLKRKWQRASSFPWLSIEPDGPNSE